MFRHVTRQGGQLKMLRPSLPARRVLGITHLTAVFDIFDDEPTRCATSAAPARSPRRSRYRLLRGTSAEVHRVGFERIL